VNVVVEEASEVATGRPGARAVGRVSVLDLAGLLASCLIVVIAFSPVLVGGRTLSAASHTLGTNGAAPFPGRPPVDHAADFRPDQGASSWALEPWAEVTHRAYANGEVPLWNSYQAAGSPHAANMQSAVFDPLLLAVNLHPTPLTWDLSIIGAFLLGACAAYVFCRVLGLLIVPAIVASAAFSLSGWFFLYSNNGFSRSYAYLPVLFLLVELVLRSRRLLPVLGLGVAVAGNIYLGMPEASLLVLGSTAFYAVARLVQERRRTPFRVSVARLGGAGVLGVMLAAPLVLLFLQYEPLSFNLHKPEAARGSTTEPQWGLLNWLVPFFAEAPSSGFAPSVRNWFGVAVGISSLAAASGRTETKRLHTWLFVALGGVLLLKIYEFRVFGWVGRLPVVEQVVWPTFAPPVVSFAFAVLAGIGVQVVMRRDLRLRRFLTTLATAFVLLVVFVGTGDRWDVITTVPHGYAAAVWTRGAFFAALAVAAVVAGSWLGRRWGALLLAVVVVAELFVLVPFSIYAKRADPYVAPSWMPLVREALAAEPHSRVFAIDGKLHPNTPGALGLQDVRALDALYVDRYLRYVRTFIAPGAGDRFTGTESPIEFRDNPMFDAFSARAVVSQRDLAGAPGLRLLGRDRDTHVYENTDALPRAWVVHDLHLVGGEDDAFAFLQARSRRKGEVFVVDRFDPRREAVVEQDGKPTDETLRALEERRIACEAGDDDRVSVERYSNDSVSIMVRAACAGLLVLPDTYFPGWTATVNGEEQEIYPTDGAFRGVVVPKGASRVEFRYEPAAFSIGIVVALAGLAAFALVGLAVWRRGRSRPRAVSADEASDRPSTGDAPPAALRPSDPGP
jgi:hypothetical protein